jgi:hypothetical protein
MPIQATVILDSGCFLHEPVDSKGAFTEIGYFCSGKSVSDIRVVADGKADTNSDQINLGKKCLIEVRHVLADGKVKLNGLTASETYHDEILHLKDLYGQHMSVDRSKFDCVIRFDSGHFCGALIKPRAFREHTKQADGKFATLAEAKPKQLKKPIAHNIYVHFKLEENEALELARDGQVFWSSRNSGATDRIEVEIVADNSTAEKFYRTVLKDKLDSYWLPNSGDPPPMCPEPPCYP